MFPSVWLNKKKNYMVHCKPTGLQHIARFVADQPLSLVCTFPVH